ncbi:MAG: PDDEXK nuclease domain-containing protein, partial [bacterium]
MGRVDSKLSFESLVHAIQEAHAHFSSQAVRAVNIGLTLRNWLIGCYIQEYEQNGTDRAEYGDAIFERLSEELKRTRRIKYHPRELRRCRQFYKFYPGIGGTMSPQSQKLLPAAKVVKIRGTASPKLYIQPERLISSLSFSHFVELLQIEEPLKRAFYEIECICGNWSVRELKRQISTLYFERSGLSKNKKKLSERIRKGAEANTPALAIRDPYVFEFLGLKPQEVMGESSVEDALLDKLQDFLIELGRGFCFEARQKRIRIGDEFFFVDMVFYHRILKCHVLIELKVDAFKHEYLGQLNTYVNWFRKNEIAAGDNPPVGILLCTRKN